MEGVFLHVLADTLGSVGVIISTLLIEYFDWTVADPICSLFIATLIFLSVVPLVRETGSILLLRTPPEMEEYVHEALGKIATLPWILHVKSHHIWRHSSKVVWATVRVQSKADVPEQKTIQEVTSLLKEVGVTNVMVQVEKPAYNEHTMGLSGTFENFPSLGVTGFKPSHKGL